MVDYGKWDSVGSDDDPAVDARYQNASKMRAQASDLLLEGQHQEACSLFKKALTAAQEAAVAAGSRWDGIFKVKPDPVQLGKCHELQHSVRPFHQLQL